MCLQITVLLFLPFEILEKYSRKKTHFVCEIYLFKCSNSKIFKSFKKF